MSRRLTIDSTSGNEPDDDIEINVGPEYDLSQIVEASKRSPVDDNEQWPEEQRFEPTRKNSTIPPNQSQNHNQSFNNNASFNNDFDNSGMNSNVNQNQMDQQFWEMMQSNNMNNMSKSFLNVLVLQYKSNGLDRSDVRDDAKPTNDAADDATVSVQWNDAELSIHAEYGDDATNGNEWPKSKLVQ